MFLPRAHWTWRRHERRRPGNKIHHWSRFCCDSLFSRILLRSFRHCIRANCRTEMAKYWTSTTNDSTHHAWNFLWSNCQRTWFLVSMYLIWIFGSRLIRSNNQSSATLWVLETCLIVGLLPFMIILISASLSSNTYNKPSWREDWTFEGTESIFSITLIFPWDFGFLLTSTLTSRPVRSEIWETRFQKQKQLDPIIPEQATHLISVQCPERWFRILLNCVKRQFVSCTSNLLEQMYDFQKCKMFLQKWIRIFKISREVRVWKQSQSASLSSITLMTILSIFTCVMNIWNQSIQAFVTGFGSFRNRSCKFIHWPWNIKSSNSCQV